MSGGRSKLLVAMELKEAWRKDVLGETDRTVKKMKENLLREKRTKTEKINSLEAR